MSEQYDWLTSLEREVDRFTATNTFTPMQVTNFYVQARCCIDEHKRLRDQLAASERRREAAEADSRRDAAMTGKQMDLARKAELEAAHQYHRAEKAAEERMLAEAERDKWGVRAEEAERNATYWTGRFKEVLAERDAARAERDGDTERLAEIEAQFVGEKNAMAAVQGYRNRLATYLDETGPRDAGFPAFTDIVVEECAITRMKELAGIVERLKEAVKRIAEHENKNDYTSGEIFACQPAVDECRQLKRIAADALRAVLGEEGKQAT